MDNTVTAFLQDPKIYTVIIYGARTSLTPPTTSIQVNNERSKKRRELRIFLQTRKIPTEPRLPKQVGNNIRKENKEERRKERRLGSAPYPTDYVSICFSSVSPT